MAFLNNLVRNEAKIHKSILHWSNSFDYMHIHMSKASKFRNEN